MEYEPPCAESETFMNASWLSRVIEVLTSNSYNMGKSLAASHT